MNAHFRADAMDFRRSGVERAIRGRELQPGAVIGPLVEVLTLEALPPAGCNRWTARRKAEVVAAVSGGLLTSDEACARYRLSVEELAGWCRAFDRFGIRALRVTHAQGNR